MTSKDPVYIINKNGKGRVWTMDEEIYGVLLEEIKKNKMDEEPEDLLLDMAEMIADTGIMGKEVIVRETYNKLEIQACGTCQPDEDSQVEPSVYVKWVKIGKKEIKIEDYLL